MAIFSLLKALKEWSFWKEHHMLVIIFSIIGVITFFYLFINFFTSLNEDRNPPFTEVALSVADRETFLTTVSYTVNQDIYEGGDMEMISGGPSFLEDFKKEAESAQDYIYITNYLWDDERFGNEMFNILIKKAEVGVRVRVLVDGVGSRKVDDEKVKALEELGGEVAFFRPIRWWNINRWNRRNHMRDIVIDGKVSYLGGVAFTDEWLITEPKEKYWHDYMFKGKGNMANRLESVFVNLWAQTTGEILPVKIANLNEKQDSHFILLFSEPAPDTSSNIEHLMWLSIMAANKTIYIENPYILPSKSIKEALIQKARMGVDVKIIDPYYTDAKHVRWASQSYYHELLDAGVRIYEYDKSRIHAKTMVVDGVWSIVGSANLDNRSSRINLELLAGVHDETFGQKLEKSFENDLVNTQEITKEEWTKQSILMTPIGLLSRLFVRQY